MDLALGTVQFGMLYGIAGGKRLPTDDAIRAILERASELGITVLDTAPSYGDIESRLGMLCNDLNFKFVSKIPALPIMLDDASAAARAIESAQVSHERLGRKLYALLFHRAEDLFGARGDAIWKAIMEWSSSKNILIGVSGYDAVAVKSLVESRRMSIAQLPGNALDQRIGSVFEKIDFRVELHLRSAFLQGLLLLPFESAIKLVPAANVALRRWHQWVQSHAMTPLQAALSIVKSFRDVATCLVGVENIGQLEELGGAWDHARPISALELACEDANTIDPRVWSIRE